MKKKIERYFSLFSWSFQNVRFALRALEAGMFTKRALDYSSNWVNKAITNTASNNVVVSGGNPLREYFDAHKEGNGIWKWLHYFETYHRHFKKYQGQEVHIVEIGVYSGGSMDMWRSYFGDKCKVYGVDIQKECLAYKKDGIDIFIGDQGDRNFWKEFTSKVPRIDIVVDDGGHTTEQQIVTLEELLPHMSNGGVYLCEDIHGTWANFSSYVYGLQKALNNNGVLDKTYKGEGYSLANSAFQKSIQSIHIYPFIVVIEKNEKEEPHLTAQKHGTVWEPFGANTMEV